MFWANAAGLGIVWAIGLPSWVGRSWNMEAVTVDAGHRTACAAKSTPCRIPIRHGGPETRRNPSLQAQPDSYAVTTRLLCTQGRARPLGAHPSIDLHPDSSRRLAASKERKLPPPPG